MVIRTSPPRYPRRGPSCLFILFILFGLVVAAFVIVNPEQVRESIIPTPIPTPTRSATEHALLADLSERDGEYEEAIRYYQEAVRLDGSKVEFYIRLINLLVKVGRPQDAVEVAEKATVLDPNNDQVWISAAATYIANGNRLSDLGDAKGADLQYAQAGQAATKALNIKETATAYAYAVAGLVLQEDPEKLDRAQEYADTAILLEPNNAVARLYMATVFTYQGQYARAIEQYQLGIEADPDLIDLYIGLAYNYYGTGSIPDAIVTFEDALLADPNNAIVYDGLAFMYIQLGQYPLAQEKAAEAVRLNPDLARAHGRLGEAFFQQSNYPEAIKELELATQMYGNPTDLNGRFFNMLATAYIRSDLELCPQAVPLFNQVLKISIPESLLEIRAKEGIEECRLAAIQSSP